MSQTMIQLSDDPHVDHRHKEILAKIRDSYGNTTQILVSNEELCELAAVCAKFPRYTDPEKARAELHSAAIDEVADVMIILDHIINIFGLSEDEVRARINGKVDRIVRWLAKSDNQEQTTVDREVREDSGTDTVCPCRGCKHVGQFQQLKLGGRCHTCSMQGWNLFESKYATGVGQGYRVRRQIDRESGKRVPWADLVVLQLRAKKQGKLFPEEVVVLIKTPNRFTEFDEESYGNSWEALWR